MVTLSARRAVGRLSGEKRLRWNRCTVHTRPPTRICPGSRVHPGCGRPLSAQLGCSQPLRRERPRRMRTATAQRQRFVMLNITTGESPMLAQYKLTRRTTVWLARWSAAEYFRERIALYNSSYSGFDIGRVR